jgi:hypothetical protein
VPALSNRRFAERMAENIQRHLPLKFDKKRLQFFWLLAESGEYV